MLKKENLTSPHDEISDGGNRGIYWRDRTVLAGWIYRRSHRDAIPLWNFRHQLHRVFPDWIHHYHPRRANPLELELAVSHASGVHRGIYDVFDI